MCGRYSLEASIEALNSIFGTDWASPFKPRYNIAPTQLTPVIRLSPTDNKLHIEPMKWGLIPSWAKDPSIGNRMINARSETVDEKPSFRSSLKQRRCIVPASGFYEWQAVAGRKHPLYIKLRDDNLMLFAGLWDHWKGPEGEVIESFSILTTGSNELIRPLHERMPVILNRESKNVWLDPVVTDPVLLKSLCNPYQSELMELYPVSDLVNSPKNDSPECFKQTQL